MISVGVNLWRWAFFGAGTGGGSVGGTESLDFSDANNSMYVALLEDI